MKTFKDFRAELAAEIWPSGEAITLRATHTKQFMAAMTDLQKNVPCLQAFNVSTFEKCARYWEDAATVVDQPNGVVRRLFTIANAEWRDKVWLWPANYHDLQRWQKTLFQAVTPANLGLKVLPQGFKFDDGTVDSTNGRARVGIWASYRHRIYVAPWLQSNETLVIEWDGIKYEWSDGDGVDTKWWTIDVQEAVKLYVRWQHERNYGDAALAQAFETDYIKKRADQMLWCWEVIREQEKKEIPEMGQNLQQAAIDDDVAPTATSSYSVCALGDWDDNANSDAVVAQIKQQNPRVVFTLGDNVYSDLAHEAIQLAKFGTIPLKPTWGNHDQDIDPVAMTSLLALVDLPNNERYYEVVDGPVHYFIVSSDPREPDGGYVDAVTSTETSIMGQWLKVKLALSTAKWKVVIFHHPPYTSDVNNTPGARWMRWPFATWGASLVLNGHAHNFEHTLGADGLNYVTCGLGGHSIRAFGANTTGTILKQYNSDFAFLKMDSSCDALTLSLVDVNGTVIYSFSL